VLRFPTSHGDHGVKYTVGSVPYLNAKPLVGMFEHLGEESQVRVVYDVPSKLPAMLASGRVQAILVSSIEALRRPDRRVAAGVCIGTQREVLSVRVFSKVPVKQIKRLALDQSSMTSNALASIVLADRYGIVPDASPMPPDLDLMLTDHDAGVLIGDNGMREQGEGLHILDLGLEWYRLTKLPFVWAAWMGTDALTPELSSYLAEAARWGMVNLESLIAGAPAETGLPPELCARYLRTVMAYPMGDRQFQGLQEFALRLRKHGILDEVHMPEIVGP